MKKTLTLILTLFTYGAYSQTSPSPGSLWLSDKLDGIRFFKNDLSFDLDGHPQYKHYYMSKDTLVMIDDYSIVPDTARHIDLFKFLTVNKGDKQLSISPINANAKKLVKQSIYHFKNFKYFRDASIKFTRIHLNAGSCYGACPVLSIDIDKSGLYYLKGGEYAQPFIGYFIGRLTDPQLDSLNYLIQRSQIKKMQGWKQKVMVNDTPPYNLTMYYNDNKKLSIQTNFAPMTVQNLIGFLVSSYKKVTPLMVDTEKHEFDEGPNMQYH